MKKYVSIDIGGTAIKYGLIREDGLILERREVLTEARKGGNSILEKTEKIVEQLLEHEPRGICISTAGMVDIEKGEIMYASPLIPRYAGIRFKETLEARFGLPCEVENDVNCAGLAEYISGVGMGCDPLLMLTVGTGIGGCLISQGQVFHGFGGCACEFGYMHMGDQEFQTLGSASSLSRRVARRKGEPGKTWNGRRIFREALKGDAVCIRAIDEMVEVLGIGIANLCYVVSPQMVVLGGGIMTQEAYLKERVQNALRRQLIEPLASQVQVGFAKHGNSAGMLGAFYHFSIRQNAFHRKHQ
ncbi:MAG: ROK family protein [Lachnospiraceae bacterium]|nr:ROK family protein [Lachnospiraceae bacterium]